MNILISNMWLIVSLIFIIVTIAGFAAYRRYFGKYKVEEVFWLNKVGILIFHESFIPRKIKPKRKQKKVKIRDDNKVLPKIIDYIEELYKVKKSSKNEIKEFQINEKNVLVCGGKNTFIITVYSGRSRKKLYSENKTLLRAMEFKYGPKLKGWKDGTSARYIKDARKTIKTILSPSESKISSKK